MSLVPGAAENTTGIVIISAVILVGGYVFLAALFYLVVYRPSRRERLEGLDDPTPPPTQPWGRSPRDDEPVVAPGIHPAARDSDDL